MKSLPIGRDRRLELLIEGFNVTQPRQHRAAVRQPAGCGVCPMIAPAFLIRTNAHTARQIQWGVRMRLSVDSRMSDASIR
jgi:hypothetical protein